MADLPSEKVQAKAAEYLLGGHVKVQFLSDEERVDFLAHVTPKDGGDPYHVKFHSAWQCDCPARVAVCAHILACQTITDLNFKPEPRKFTRDTSIDDLLGGP